MWAQGKDPETDQAEIYRFIGRFKVHELVGKEKDGLAGWGQSSRPQVDGLGARQMGRAAQEHSPEIWPHKQGPHTGDHSRQQPGGGWQDLFGGRPGGWLKIWHGVGGDSQLEIWESWLACLELPIERQIEYFQLKNQYLNFLTWKFPSTTCWLYANTTSV